jgi:phosphatidylserine/phosphatidylglycerophosphate/cardiolipin synthase-like enzyme
MFDPVHHADNYEIEEYVGESPHLSEEIDRIREWRTNQPHDAVTFVEAVREVCSRPLEEESVSPRLRVMTPWLNFIIKEYTALFHRLLKNGIKIQLLFRLPDPSGWNNLKQEFLTRIGNTHGNLELRTYTRYKKYKDHTQLRKHKRDEPDDEGDSYVSETGIHGKLFIAGTPEDGAALAGSANLMENSFYYNPEAGLYTRHPEVIQTTADYFDLIWELAEPDTIDESVYTGKTNFEFYPKVYRP